MRKGKPASGRSREKKQDPRIDKLPTGKECRFRFRPPSGGLKKAKGSPGWLDKRGSRWEWTWGIGPGRTCEHWDVIHPDGEHSNIGPDGEKHHLDPCMDWF